MTSDNTESKETFLIKSAPKKKIAAKIQPRIASSTKGTLQNVVPLATPYSAHIDICSICNFRCTFCFQSDKKALKEKGIKLGLMEMKLFKKIVDDLGEFKDKLRKIKIGNLGEPTLHPQLVEMISYINSKNIADVIEVFTHGAQLNPKLNLALVEAGLKRINISVEGINAEAYKKVAGVNIDMDEFVGNIKHLYDNRKQLAMYVKIVDVGMSEDDKQNFYNMFGNICDEIFIENVVPQWPITNKFAIDMTGMYGQKINKYKYVCPFPFMYLHFNFDGSVSGCTLDWSKEVLIGDVTKQSAVEIWNGDQLKKLQIKMLEKKRDQISVCDKCLAPMVCCMDDLDDEAEKILNKIKV